ncbi:hypothetical protein LUZ60_000129 [Juncus effusus]|nr:hypothetical protein LUZ60_000129 [Juncus effusus]
MRKDELTVDTRRVEETRKRALCLVSMSQELNSLVSSLPPPLLPSLYFFSRSPLKSLFIRMDISLAATSASTMIFYPILEDGVLRFDCSMEQHNEAYPSLSFADPMVRETPIKVVGTNPSPDFVPAFECVDGQQKVEFKLPAGTSFHGTGEASGPLERTGKRIFTWNTDAWGYGPGTTSLYQSHPWVLAVLPDGKALGVLADTTRRCEVDLREECVVRIISAASFPVITFGPFKSPNDVIISLSKAIGTVFMPPKWALGYQQCRWSYDTADRVLEVAETFRKKDIPCDVIWMDIDYMDGFRCFTFDKDRFPDPKSMAEKLHEIGFKAVWMLDPGLKREEGYFAYDRGSKADLWVQQVDGTPYVGDVWPGPCVFPDFTQERTRTWWAQLVRDFMSNGVDGIWNDMNEPAVTTVTKTMPDSNIHRGDINLGGKQNHPFYHNVYGLLMIKSTHEGMKMGNPNKRPFVLTRAGFIGSQRYAATWTGDNLSNWEHLHMSLSMVLQLGLSGQPLSGPDIGGFAGNASPKLFGRWMGIGSLFPFSRGHSEKGSTDHEPWSFGEECEEVCRLALLRRSRLIPHIYTLFYLAHTKGIPVATPVFFSDPLDPKLRTVENAFLLGPLIVYSSTSPDKSAHELSHVIPNGIWLPFDFGDSHPDLPILYLQGGGILPVGIPHKHVGEAKLEDDLTLFIALDKDGRAEGVLFEDEGDGYGYTNGEYLLTYYVAEMHSSVVTVKVFKTEGSWKRPKRTLHIHLLLGGYAMIKADGIDGKEIQITLPPEITKLVSLSENHYKTRLETAKAIPDIEELHEYKGIELLKTPINLKSGDWYLKLVPWIGGRVISMIHLPTDTEWLYSRIESDGYEEYTDSEYQSSGCTEKYEIIRREEESIYMEGDLGGGLVLQRGILILKNNPKLLQFDSSIITKDDSSRLVCLRVHPTFNLLHPSEVVVTFTSIDGSSHEILPEIGEQSFEGNRRPNGEWMLVDKCVGLSLVSCFDTNQVSKCIVKWAPCIVSLELWSEERSIAKETPLRILHSYEVRKNNM